MRVPLEADEQKLVVRWLDAHRLLFFAIPNGAHLAGRGPAQWSRLKALGCRPGVPDMVIVTPPPRGPMLAVFVEMKRRTGGRVSDEQARWHESLRLLGHTVIVAAGADEAIAELTGLGYG